MTKRLFYFIVALALVLSLAACGGGESNSSTEGQEPGNSSSVTDSGSSNASSSQSPGSSGDASASAGSSGGRESSSPSENPAPGSGGGENSSPSSSPSQSESPSPSSSPSPSDTTGSGGGEGEAGLSGAPEDILTKLIEDLRNAGAQMPMSMPPMAAPEAERHNAIGLSDADYSQYVMADAQSIAGISTFAHQIIIYQCVDDSAAAQVKNIITSSGGYDPQKWICVFPEKAVAVDAGNYVLLVASTREVVDMAAEIFVETAVTAGSIVTFYEGPV